MMVSILVRVLIGVVVASCCVCGTRADQWFTRPSGRSSSEGQEAADDVAYNYQQRSRGRGRVLLDGANIGATDGKIVTDVDEGKSIHIIDKPIQQRDSEWGRPGKGISMDLTGEPKSGTTWTQRILTELAAHLCGSETNKWCEMGGLKVIPRLPDPSYIWEMLHADTGKVFLHFDGRIKHIIPGFKINKRCLLKGRWHALGFAKSYPCLAEVESLSRKQLVGCLPSTDGRCASYMPSRDPNIRRMPVVFRDPRDVVISSYGYRTKTVVVERHDVETNLQDFIDHYFEIIVSWQHQRWVWHTTFYREASHVMFYEDLKASHLPLVDLAAFMGLECTPQQALEAWGSHTMSSTHKDYNSFNIPTEKIQYMNATMSKLLPPEMAIRYGLTPIDS